MLIKITSDNPEFLSLMQKNPDSFNGLHLRKIKNGVAVGRIVSPNEYHMFFQDTKYSFVNDISNQIDFQSYCNPKVFLAFASRFLRHIFKDKDEYFSQEIPWLGKSVREVDAEGFTHTFEIDNIYVNGIPYKRGFVLSKYFPGITLERKLGAIFSLKIVSNNSLFELLNLAALTCLYLAITNKQHWYITEDISRKYLRIIKNLYPVPYFVLYLFARICLSSRPQFEELNGELEEAFDGDVSFTYGNTQVMRIESVKESALIDDVIPENVIEVGCSEMDYPKKLLRYMKEDSHWYSNDINDYSHLVPNVIKRTGNDRFSFVNDYNVIPKEKDYLLLLVEVIEHMPYNDAVVLVSDLVSKFNPKRIIITTPNFDFNKNFAFEDRTYRHDDHHFELTREQFEAFLLSITFAFKEFDGKVGVNTFDIGDVVNGEPLTFGACIWRD